MTEAAPIAQTLCDVVVVGAGIGGIYATHRFVQCGLSVIGIEGASDVGGVWYHNRYPGARVDLEGLHYCYHDPEIYREWEWKERYPGQPELLSYLNFAADKWDIRRYFRFDTWVTGAHWDPDQGCYEVTTHRGDVIHGRFLVMASGPLSAARMPNIPGLEDFRGEVIRTAHWPTHEVNLRDKRIGIIGTSASGVQAIPHLAEAASHLYVFQRTAHYSAPAHNGPLPEERQADFKRRAEHLWEELSRHPGGTDIPMAVGPAANFTPSEQQALLEERWAYGGHTMASVFTDQGFDWEANGVVAEFFRSKIRQTVKTRKVAELLMPRAYPVGTHRLCVDVNYYETYNRDNVTLVSLLENPIDHFTDTGVQTADSFIELDVLILATGFIAITGALFNANITDGKGVSLREHWQRGPHTYLGLTTRGFPNLFLLTGPGSPSVLANMFADNEQHVEYLVSLFAYMAERGYHRVEPTDEAQVGWMRFVDDAASRMLRYQVTNYMLHENADDGSKVFMPYPGGFDRYVQLCNEIASDNWRGFDFD